MRGKKGTGGKSLQGRGGRNDKENGLYMKRIEEEGGYRTVERCEDGGEEVTAEAVEDTGKQGGEARGKASRGKVLTS